MIHTSGEVPIPGNLKDVCAMYDKAHELMDKQDAVIARIAKPECPLKATDLEKLKELRERFVSLLEAVWSSDFAPQAYGRNSK